MNIYVSILSASIAIAALLVSFFNYRRSLKLQNENIIYAKKVDAYMEFSTHLWRLVNKIDEISSLVTKVYNKAR